MSGAFDSSFDASFDIGEDDGPLPTTFGTDIEPLDSRRGMADRIFGVLDTVSRRYTQLVATAVSILRN